MWRTDKSWEGSGRARVLTGSRRQLGTAEEICQERKEIYTFSDEGLFLFLLRRTFLSLLKTPTWLEIWPYTRASDREFCANISKAPQTAVVSP